MYSIDLNKPGMIKKEEILGEIQSDEFVYLRIPNSFSTAEINLNDLIASITSRTSRLFVSIESFETISQFKKYELLYPISWFGVPVKVGSNQFGGKNNQTLYSGVDSNSLEIFENLKNKFIKNSKMIPEFQLTENHYQLGPTIVEFFNRYKIPFAFLNITKEPTDASVLAFRETFESLRVNGFKGKIYFSFNNNHLEEWNLKTFNTFSGLQTVHIDLSNKCTHSCVFCGVWGPDFIDEMKSKSPNNIIGPELIDFMNRQMSFVKAIEILESLPETVKTVQFGGVGDPLTHPQWLNILSRWKSRGFNVEVLTNFEYPSFNEIDILHEHSRGKKNLDFMVNISAASAGSYIKVRPRQTTMIYEKVIANIRYANELKKRDGFGLNFVLINIINEFNYFEAVKMIELAYDLGASVWLKPLEVHSEIHKNFSIKNEHYDDFQKIMKAALLRADQLRIDLVMRSFVEAIVGEV